MSLDTAGCLAGLGTMFISCNFLHLRFSEILPASEGEGGCCFPSHVRLYLSLLTGDSTLLVVHAGAVGENSVHAVWRSLFACFQRTFGFCCNNKQLQYRRA